MLTRVIILGTMLMGLSYGLASAADSVDLTDCQAAKAAFDSYSMKLNDPDAADAKSLADEGADDCRKGNPALGSAKINHAMGMMHDGTHTPKTH
jgi:hypothetical protein